MLEYKVYFKLKNQVETMIVGSKESPARSILLRFKVSDS